MLSDNYAVTIRNIKKINTGDGNSGIFLPCKGRPHLQKGGLTNTTLLFFLLKRIMNVQNPGSIWIHEPLPENTYLFLSTDETAAALLHRALPILPLKNSRVYAAQKCQNLR